MNRLTPTILLAVFLVSGCGNLKFVCDNRGGRLVHHGAADMGFSTCEDTDKDREKQCDSQGGQLVFHTVGDDGKRYSTCENTEKDREKPEQEKKDE